MSYNNIYNFKNPIRHFINIDWLNYPSNISALDIEDTCWTQPIKFRIQKDADGFRTLKLPNILQTVCAYEHFKNFPDFSNPQNLDIDHKMLSPVMETGDFKIGAYDEQLENDFNNLCIYDNLLRLDIKEFYGRIYTHYLDFNGLKDRYITNMNMGATNGLIMGNYLSLYFAEQHLSKISKRVCEEINSANISCEFSYFSDDFYFFCNKHDNEMLINIFDKVLEEFDLERNTDKIEFWDYSTYNQENLMTRYWKKINYYCNTHFSSDSDNNKLVFINQLIYRSSSFKTEKQKRVFINNFFKSKYFRTLDISKFEFRDYDYHQLCFLFRTSPEALLYSIDVLQNISNFDKSNIKKFFEIRYSEALNNPCHDVQLYYYYALNILNFTDIIANYGNQVLKSENQILISYYIENDLFDTAQLDLLKQFTDEQYWFQSYHLIMHCSDLYANIDQSIETYLVPKKSLPNPTDTPTTIARRKIYADFYKDNLLNGLSILNTVVEAEQEIHDYLDLRFAEEMHLYS
jgi:hypothetical protein